MYACVRETGYGFFAGMCAACHRSHFSCEPPYHLGIREITPANGRRRKSENGAEDSCPVRSIRHLWGVLCHKLIDVVVVAVIYAVDDHPYPLGAVRYSDSHLPQLQRRVRHRV
jgi:hypothetical protein